MASLQGDGDGDSADLAAGSHRGIARDQEEIARAPTRFDRFAVAMGRHTTRRTALAVLAALGLTGVAWEEAGAVCKAPDEECHGNRACCSGVCRNKSNRCACPDRICCQCSTGEVPCTFVTDPDACTKRCLKRTGSIESGTFHPNPGVTTTLCEGTQCRDVDCFPT